METSEKNQKQSQQSQQSNSINNPLNPQQTIPCQIPQHLKIPTLPLLTQQSITQLLNSSNFHPTFTPTPTFTLNPTPTPNFHIQILYTNFESMKLSLSYLTLKMQISVLYTGLEESIIPSTNSRNGQFGLVRFLEYEGEMYAVKGLELKVKGANAEVRLNGVDWQHCEIDAQEAYREYFLCAVAGVLGVGPKVMRLFGYDLVITKKMVFFAMEQCSKTRTDSIQELKKQLMENLQIMHSINLTHMDIKPENIAYSRYQKKHIFIDYGLSKMVVQKPGQKSLTKFQGTLTYCSDQMKKCYLCSRESYVDLYGNDFVCLNKSMRVYECLGKGKGKGDGEGEGEGEGGMMEEDLGEEQQEQEEEEEEEDDVLGMVVFIVRLKYWLQTENVGEILKIRKSSIEKRITFYHIFNNSRIPQSLTENPPIQQLLTNIKTNLIQPHPNSNSNSNPNSNSKSKSNCKSNPNWNPNPCPKITSTLHQYFSKQSQAVSADKIAPISLILSSTTSYFCQYLQKCQLVAKLFYFLQAVYWNCYNCVRNYGNANRNANGNGNGNGNGDEDGEREDMGRNRLKRILIERIYQVKQCEIEGPVFFAEKVRFVLMFFYQKLKHLKNFRIMSAIRVLFICLQQWAQIKKIETQILQTIEQPFLKLLKFTQYKLFRILITQICEYEKNPQWFQTLEQLTKNLTEFRQLKLKQLAIAIMSKGRHFEQPEQFKKSMLRDIEIVKEFCDCEMEKEAIFNIWFIWVGICRLEFPGHCVRTLEHRKIVEFFVSRKRLIKTQQQQQQQALFQPLRAQSKTVPKSQITRLFNSQLAITKSRQEPQTQLLNLLLSSNIANPKYLHYFLNTIKQDCSKWEVNYNSNYNYNYNGSTSTITITSTSMQIYGKFVLFGYFLEFMGKCWREDWNGDWMQDWKEDRKQQIVQGVEEVFQAFVGLGVVRAVIAQFRYLEIFQMIIRVTLSLEKGRDPEQMKDQIEKIVAMLSPLPSKYPFLVSHFLKVYSHLKPPTNPPTKQISHQFLKDVLLNFLSAYISSNSLDIFQKKQLTFLSYFIKFNNEDGNYQHNLHFLLTMIRYFDSEDEEKRGRISPGVFVVGVDWFLGLAVTGVMGVEGGFGLRLRALGQLYLGVRFVCREFLCGMYAYLVAALFITVRSQLREEDQLRQIIRSTLCLKLMSPICQKFIRCQLLRVLKTLKKFSQKSKRRAYITKKLQIHYSIWSPHFSHNCNPHYPHHPNSNKSKILIKQLNDKSDKFLRRNWMKGELVRERFLEKVKQVQRVWFKLG